MKRYSVTEIFGETNNSICVYDGPSFDDAKKAYNEACAKWHRSGAKTADELDYSPTDGEWRKSLEVCVLAYDDEDDDVIDWIDELSTNFYDWDY